jgi:hypothetical protein
MPKVEKTGVRRYTLRILDCGMGNAKGTAEAQRVERNDT